LNFLTRAIGLAAPIALLALPFALTIGPAVSEPCIGTLIAALIHASVVRHDWSWLWRPWFLFAALWCGWLIICSLPGIAAAETFPLWTLQAVLTMRLPLCAAAIAWLLGQRGGLSRALHAAVVLVALYIVVQLGWQFVTGANFFGEPMRDNGLLTGPFNRPRAGPIMMLLFFPVLLPPVAWLVARGAFGRFMGAGLLAAGFAVLLPIGQRMPILLVGLGLVVAVLMLPALRRAAIVAVFVGSVVLAAGAILFPQAQHRLTVHFAGLMGDFPSSHHGLIFSRALAMADAHPWHGRGFAAFRTGCAEERYFVVLLDSQPKDGGGADICVTHAHNLYLEALTDAGWPGLLLFSGFAIASLLTLVRPAYARHTGLSRYPRLQPGEEKHVDTRIRGHDDGGIAATRDPIAIALFIAAFLYLWPIAAGNPFTNAYTGGWFILLLGWGLAPKENPRLSPGVP